MSDDDKKGKLPEGEGGNGSDDGKGADDAPTASSYQKLKVANEKLAEKLQAQETLTAAERRKAEDRIKALEAKSEEPPQDSERIAALEVSLARSQAVSRYGLSEDDAELLKGTPEEIKADAEYWAERLKELKVEDDKDKGKSTRELIDEKLDEGKDDDKPPKKPTPKKGNLSWMEEYKGATPEERAVMLKSVYDGDVDPRPSKNK